VHVGQVWLRRLRIVDAFGRTLPIIGPGSAGTTRPVVASAWRPDPSARHRRAWRCWRRGSPPPSRLLLRLVDRADDAVEARIEQSVTEGTASDEPGRRVVAAGPRRRVWVPENPVTSW
jgi:hypothetical protein